MWKRPLTRPSFGFRSAHLALSPQAGRGRPHCSAIAASVGDGTLGRITSLRRNPSTELQRQRESAGFAKNAQRALPTRQSAAKEPGAAFPAGQSPKPTWRRWSESDAGRPLRRSGSPASLMQQVQGLVVWHQRVQLGESAQALPDRKTFSFALTGNDLSGRTDLPVPFRKNTIL